VDFTNKGHQEYFRISNDGLKLFVQSWMPHGRPFAIINYVHGFKDHSDRFAHWARQLNEHGYGVVAFDLRGHGRSEGRRGHAKNFDCYLGDVQNICQASRASFPGIPLVLYGHSLGGNIVTNYLVEAKELPDAAIIASPWFKLAFEPSAFTRFMARLLRYLFPGIQVKSSLSANGLSRDPSVVKSYNEDPLVHNRISPKLFFAIEKNGLKASRSIYKINMPLLVMHGSGDVITACRQTRSFIQNTGVRTVYREWPGAFHELHNDICREEVFTFVLDWLNRQFKDR